MNIKVMGRNVEITDAIRNYVEEKSDRLGKFENENSDLTVVCSIEREEQIVEMQLSHNGDFIKIEERNNDLYASIDLAFDRIERQMRREKEKKLGKNKAAYKERLELLVDGNDNGEKEGEITNTLCYDIKPITIEDAKLKLEESDNLFLPFVNVETNKVEVIYRRNNGEYGLVMPE